MQLGLETHGQSVGDDFLDQFAPPNGRLAGGNFLEAGVLLVRCERMHPGEKQRTDFLELVPGNLFFGPLIIFQCADDEFDFVSGFQMRDVLREIAGNFAGGGAFEVHDAMDARVHFRYVMRAAGFQEDGEAGITELLHKRQGIFLEQRFAAGQFNQRQGRVFERCGEFFDLCDNIRERHFFPLGKSVSGVAIGTAQITGGKTDENAGQPGEGAFALQTQIDFVDDECIGHRLNVTWRRRMVNLIVYSFVAQTTWKFP
jgi:hypothetical protein